MQYLPLALLTLHLGLDDAGSLAQVPSPLFSRSSYPARADTIRPHPRSPCHISGTLLAFCEGASTFIG